VIAYVSTRQAPMATVTSPVTAGLIGPGGDQVAGLIGDVIPPPGHGAAIDDVLADHEARLSALESSGPEGGEDL
jgi:hypothetical protein